MYQRIQERLRQDRCPFRVAVFASTDPDVGPLIEVHAFDVPAEHCVRVSRRLNHLLWGAEVDTNLIAGAFDREESAERRDELPANVIWYSPGTDVMPAADYAATLAEMVRDRFPGSR